jgi:hypothetical protein
MSLFSTSKELIVQATKIFGSKEEDVIRTIVRQVLTEPQYSSKWGKKNAPPKPMPGTKDPPPLPDDLQTMTVSVPTVVVNGAGTFYGWQKVAIHCITESYHKLASTEEVLYHTIMETQCQMSSILLYIKKGGHDTKYPPPYGQMVIPFNSELSVRKLPVGLSLSLWWTQP